MKKLVFNLLMAIAILVPAVFWLLSALPGTKDTFGGFGFSWFACIAAFAIGILLILRGFINQKLKSYRNVYILAALILVLGGAVSLVGALAMPVSIIMPIITIIIAFCGLLLSLTGVSQWDKADNQEDGYQKYEYRKAKKGEKF